LEGANGRQEDLECGEVVHDHLRCGRELPAGAHSWKAFGEVHTIGFMSSDQLGKSVVVLYILRSDFVWCFCKANWLTMEKHVVVWWTSSGLL
jgi:hypothetical protein